MQGSAPKGCTYWAKLLLYNEIFPSHNLVRAFARGNERTQHRTALGHLALLHRDPSPACELCSQGTGTCSKDWLSLDADGDPQPHTGQRTSMITLGKIGTAAGMNHTGGSLGRRVNQHTLAASTATWKCAWNHLHLLSGKPKKPLRKTTHGYRHKKKSKSRNLLPVLMYPCSHASLGALPQTHLPCTPTSQIYIFSL